MSVPCSIIMSRLSQQSVLHRVTYLTIMPLVYLPCSCSLTCKTTLFDFDSTLVCLEHSISLSSTTIITLHFFTANLAHPQASCSTVVTIFQAEQIKLSLSILLKNERRWPRSSVLCPPRLQGSAFVTSSLFSISRCVPSSIITGPKSDLL